MGVALGYTATGLIGLSLVSLLIWLASVRLRSPTADSVWASDWMATTIALLLVAGLVVASAQLVNGLLQVIPDPMTATAAGIIASCILPLVVLRALFGMSGAETTAEKVG